MRANRPRSVDGINRAFNEVMLAVTVNNAGGIEETSERIGNAKRMHFHESFFHAAVPPVAVAVLVVVDDWASRC